MNLIAEKIENLSLTKSQRKIADYFIHNQEKIVTMSSMDAANMIGVSDASVIRFARAIGYEGYTDLKEQIYATLVNHTFSGIPLTERMERNDARFSNSNLTEQFLSLVEENGAFAFNNNRMKQFEEIADGIVKARNRYVVGLRGCRGVAQRFARLLMFMLSKVECITDSECTSINHVQDMQKGDVMLMFVFSRFYKIDLHYAQLAKNRGAKFFLVTNDITGPLSPYADIILVVQTNSMNFFHSTIGTDIVAEYLLTLIAHHEKIDYKERIAERDRITEDQRI